jgi:hypothetical protein
MTRVSEGEITPVTVKQGLNRQQQQARQMPAKFQPKKISVLAAKTDPPHPARGLAVGAMENTELGRAMVAHMAALGGRGEGEAKKIASNWDQSQPSLSEAMSEIEEDMLGKIRQDLNDYLRGLEDRVQDDGRRDRQAPELDRLGTKQRQDRDLISKVKITAPEQTTPVRTVALEDGTLIEIHGDDAAGYELRRGHLKMPTRFPRLDLAEIALELYRGHHREKQQNQDYIDEK